MNSNTALNEAYRGHPVFQQLPKYVDFYEQLSMSVMGFSTQGTRSILNIDSYLYTSVKGTLESMTRVLENGRIGDAYALLRRYYDSSMINVYSNLYLKENFSLENFVVKQIQDWLGGKQQLPEFRGISNYIRSSQRLKDINGALYADARYKEIRERCNAFTHYNFFSNVLLNDNQVYLEHRPAALDGFSKDLDNVLVLHLAYLFYLNDHYMMSSDYVDYLEIGSTPPEGSQYLVAPFIQEMFDAAIKTNRPDIAKLIKETTAMQLE